MTADKAYAPVPSKLDVDFGYILGSNDVVASGLLQGRTKTGDDSPGSNPGPIQARVVQAALTESTAGFENTSVEQASANTMISPVSAFPLAICRSCISK